MQLAAGDHPAVAVKGKVSGKGSSGKGAKGSKSKKNRSNRESRSPYFVVEPGGPCLGTVAPLNPVHARESGSLWSHLPEADALLAHDEEYGLFTRGMNLGFRYAKGTRDDAIRDAQVLSMSHDQWGNVMYMTWDRSAGAIRNIAHTTCKT